MAKPKFWPGVLMGVGLVLVAAIFSKVAHEPSPQYQASLNSDLPIPPLAALVKVSGSLNFTNRRKGGGGQLIVYGEGDTRLVLVCSPPGHESGPACYTTFVDGQWINFEKKAFLQKGTAWYDPATNRLFQIAVGNELLMRYENMASYYAAYKKK